MRTSSRFSVLGLGVAILLGLSSAAVSLADDAPATAPATAAATGTISGKVVDATGNAVKGVTVDAMAPDAKGKKAVPLATATTGDDGTFKIADVPAGSVKLVAKSDTITVKIKKEVTVTAGQDTKVDDINLVAKAKKNKKNKNAAAAPAAN